VRSSAHDLGQPRCPGCSPMLREQVGVALPDVLLSLGRQLDVALEVGAGKAGHHNLPEHEPGGRRRARGVPPFIPAQAGIHRLIPLPSRAALSKVPLRSGRKEQGATVATWHQPTGNQQSRSNLGAADPKAGAGRSGGNHMRYNVVATPLHDKARCR